MLLLHCAAAIMEFDGGLSREAAERAAGRHRWCRPTGLGGTAGAAQRGRAAPLVPPNGVMGGTAGAAQRGQTMFFGRHRWCRPTGSWAAPLVPPNGVKQCFLFFGLTKAGPQSERGPARQRTGRRKVPLADAQGARRSLAHVSLGPVCLGAEKQMVSVQKANGVSSNFQAVRTNSSRENRTGTNSAPTPIPPHDAQVRPGFDHLPIAYRSRDIAQALPVGKVGLESNTELPACHRERIVYPGRATVDDYQAWAVPRSIRFTICYASSSHRQCRQPVIRIPMSR